MEEVDRLGDLAVRCGAQQHAARRECVGHQCPAVVRAFAWRAQARERRVRFALDERREVEDLEPGRRRIRERGVEAPVHEYDASRRGKRQHARGEQGGGWSGRGRRVEFVPGDARVIEVPPVLVAPAGQAARAQRLEGTAAAMRPRRAAGLRQAARGEALDGASRRSRGRRPFAQPVVAAALELECELAPAALHDAPAGEHVHAVRHHVIEQALVVGDEHHRALGCSGAH